MLSLQSGFGSIRSDSTSITLAAADGSGKNPDEGCSAPQCRGCWLALLALTVYSSLMLAGFPIVACPKCGRKLPPADVQTSDGGFPVYTCDECVMVVDFMGEKMELPLTFSLNEKGEPFDPASPDGKLKL